MPKPAPVEPVTPEPPRIDFYVLRTVGDDTRRVPVPVGVATSEHAVAAYVATAAAWDAGERVPAHWPHAAPPAVPAETPPLPASE